MTTGNTETLAEAPAAAAGDDLITHLFTDGICLDPETIKVPMPKGCTCEILLARHADGGWRIGYSVSVGKEDSLKVPPAENDISYVLRSLALDAALDGARLFFAASPKSKTHKKCAGELTAFAKSLESLPANKSKKAKVTLPEPKSIDVRVDRLEENPHNPRGPINIDEVTDLANTIADVGLLQPIGVRVIVLEGGLPGIEGDNRLQLLWGHRRAAAFRRLQRETIPARVYEGITDEQARLLLLIENGQQKPLDPIQEARGYSEMVRDFGLTQDEVATQVKKSRPVVANALRLLDLPAKVQELIAERKLTTRHGTALARFKDWPKVCEQIAIFAVEDGASANSLEQDLPYAEDLADDKLAIDLLEGWTIKEDTVKKAYNGKPGFFFWKEDYDRHMFTLDLVAGKQILADAKKANDEQEEKEAKRREERSNDSSGEGSGGLTPSERRERKKKLDENLTNRLQVTAMQHVAIERIKSVETIDKPSLLVVVREAFAHAGTADLSEIAKQLGIKLPKGFDSFTDWDQPLDGLAKMNLADVLRLAAAALALRDADHAMRYASEVPAFVDMLGREAVDGPLDPQSYLTEWHDKILPLVQAGKKAPDVQTELGCPEFIAVQMVRTIRREIKEAGGQPAAAAPSKTAEPQAFEGKESGQSGSFASKEASIEWLDQELKKPGCAGYKCVFKKLAKNVHVILFSRDRNELAELVSKKPAKKAAPAKAKGGKKK